MPRSADSPDADPDRSLPGADTDAVQQPGGPGQSFGQTVPVDHVRSDPFGDTGQQRVPVDGPEPTGPVAHRDAGAGGRDDLGTTENDADAVAGSATAVKSNDDVVDDADLPGSVLPGLAERVAAVLGRVQPHRDRHTVFHYRLGAAIPIVPATRRGTSGTRASGGSSRPTGE